MKLEKKARAGKRVALASVVVSASLAVIKIIIEEIGHSAAVVAVGLESAGDVIASGFVLVGFFIAAKDTSQKLTDKLPASELLDEIRRVANGIRGVAAMEKCYARSTGLQYYVDLPIEVDPELTVQSSHDIATETRFAIRRHVDWVADVVL